MRVYFFSVKTEQAVSLVCSLLLVWYYGFLFFVFDVVFFLEGTKILLRLRQTLLRRLLGLTIWLVYEITTLLEISNTARLS